MYYISIMDIELIVLDYLIADKEDEAVNYVRLVYECSLMSAEDFVTEIKNSLDIY